MKGTSQASGVFHKNGKYVRGSYSQQKPYMARTQNLIRIL